MYSKHFCIDCENNWDLVPYTKEEGQKCPSCGSSNTRHQKPEDPDEKSESIVKDASGLE